MTFKHRLPFCAKMLGLVQRALKCKSGNFAVEFALITPIMAIVFMVGFDVSVALYRKMEMETAAKTAIQYGMLRKPVENDLTGIRQTAENNLPNAWSSTVTPSLTCQCPSSGQISCTLTCGGGEFRQTYLNVQVSMVHQTLFNYPLLSRNIPLSVSSSMRLQ